MKKLIYKALKSKPLMLTLKWLAILALLVILYLKVFRNGDFSFQNLYLLLTTLIKQSPWVIGVLVLLVLVNWFSDTYVWYKSVKSMVHISFGDALKNNLVSQYLGIIVPFGLGEYGGKTALFNESQQKKESLIVTLSYRISKAWAKWVVGCFALVYLMFQQPLSWWHLLLIVPIGLTLIVFFKSALMYQVLFQLRFFNTEGEIKLDTQRLKVYRTFLPALLKFLSYCFQFAFVISHVEGLVFINAFVVGVIIYAVASFFPQASFLDPFIKSGIGIFLTPFAVSDQGILLATMVVWILNAGIPALIGGVLWLAPKPSATA